MRKMRADLSGPVLAIIITVAIIAAGLGIAAYFWYLAPSASKTPTLTILGEPAVIDGEVAVTVKNIGSSSIKVTKVIVGGVSEQFATPYTVNPGESVTIETTSLDLSPSTPVVEGVLVTDAGVYPFSAYVVSGASQP